MFRKFRGRMKSEQKPYECLRCHLCPGHKKYDTGLGNVDEYDAL
jgi:hypothetical protein